MGCAKDHQRRLRQTRRASPCHNLAHEREKLESTPETRAASRKALAALDGFYTPLNELFSDESAAEIRQGTPEAVEWAVCYLELDPYYFRSGYNKSWLIRQLKQAPLPVAAQQRLRSVFLRVLDDPSRALKYHLQLAAKVASAEWIAEIQQRLHTSASDSEQSRRVASCLDYLHRHRSSSTPAKHTLP